MSDFSPENTTSPLSSNPSQDLFSQLSDQVLVQGLRGFTIPDPMGKFGPYTPDNVPIYIYKRMRRDSGIKVGLVLLKSLISSVSRYRIAGSTPEVRGFIKEILWPKLPDLLKKVLNALDFGFQTIELVYDVQTVKYEVERPNDSPIRQKRTATVIRKFADLDPEHVEVMVDPKTQKFAGIKYNTTDYMPPAKVLHVVFDPEFGSMYGTSVLDPAYKYWWTANVIELLWGRWMEKLSAGVYVGQAPAKATRDEKGNKQYPIKVLLALLMALRSSGVVVIPNDPDPVTKENKYKVELLESRHSGESFQKNLDYNQNMKLRSILFPEKILGSVVSEASGSSFASHESFMDLYFLWVNWIVDTVVLGPINEQIIKRLVAYNFPSRVRPPRLEVTPLDKQTKRLFVDILKATLNDPVLFDRDNDSKKLTSGNIDTRELAKMLGLPLREPEDVPELPADFVPISRNDPRKTQDSSRNKVSGTPDNERAGSPQAPDNTRE